MFSTDAKMDFTIYHLYDEEDLHKNCIMELYINVFFARFKLRIFQSKFL